MLPELSNAIEVPPIPVAEKTTVDAAASNSIRNGCCLLSETAYAPEVTGKPLEALIPLITIWPCGVSAMAFAVLLAEPPTKTENTTVPVGPSLVTNDRGPDGPVEGVASLPPVAGNAGLPVAPVTYTLPALSTAIARTSSELVLSRNTKY